MNILESISCGFGSVLKWSVNEVPKKGSYDGIPDPKGDKEGSSYKPVPFTLQG